MPVAMHDECRESSDMTHVLPVRCVASKMKWAVGSARSATTAAAAAAARKICGRSHCLSNNSSRTQIGPSYDQ